ncbi:hypothetical protein TGME49_275700 [Toxoplasma gondii ME49]|uniref:Transmembrane protein n=10 Tax=Toxoplasma gondii TaxID=5811 RepID=A0A125YWR4_TOXGV|nr:hypothetical protein TGME49_275700 [Toxoplasma gondii ME49]EPR59220.1 hypothetical protein TGGT1_275700 [Toxoplasma gondii GT1]ESS30175.1 hypothetical protein TGVEG_275700 [Toxoplasma gondii VEG]KAF4645477.1 hypothetical protein TGRH88_005810 [Toxoplasma gondii]KFG29989.1 hypothetical protein TGDOM2_275700 [Toxoplasma gondii GAB2-2007-GAL-DOM2]KFG37236.1 hypothetical protein TGFOU_275700 [Toxoplasma gondii FOU]KFG47442.1 hypothetical protein TGP89_275700 [Toxoplasma gondii p89]KFG57965.1 |eukprot:XP_018638230.1 hypothetical protein TGME49_275700 [Toxoplasma gondii ME49]
MKIGGKMMLVTLVFLVCAGGTIAESVTGLTVRGRESQGPTGQALNSLLMSLVGRSPYNTSAGQIARVTQAPQLAIHLSKAKFDDSISQSTATPFIDIAQERIDENEEELAQIRDARRNLAANLDTLYAYEIPNIPQEKGRLRDYLRNPPFLTRYGPTYKTTLATPEHFTNRGIDTVEMSPITMLLQDESTEAHKLRGDLEKSVLALERGDYVSPGDLIALEATPEI